MIESAGMNTNEDFIVAKVRFIDVCVMKYAGIAVLMKNDGFHERPPGIELVHMNSFQTYRNTICWRYPSGLFSKGTLRPRRARVQMERIDRAKDGP